MLVLLASQVLANTWAPVDQGFVTDPREDAPTDARLIYGANFLPEVQVVTGPGAPFPLSSVYVTGVGAPPRAAIEPPGSGWESGASYVVSVSPYYEGSEGGDELSFTVGDAPAPAPAMFDVLEVTVGEWSEDTSYAWGCCHPVREVQVEVEVPDADPWSYVEVVGDFRGPSQITTQPHHQHLDVALGPGTHVLTLEQWLEDDGVPEPRCFDVVTVSASGIAADPATFCPGEEDDTGSDTAGTAGTVASDGACGAGRSALLLPMLPLAWRRSRRGGHRTCTSG